MFNGSFAFSGGSRGKPGSCGNATTKGRKEKGAHVSLLGNHLNTLGSGLDPTPRKGSGPGLLRFGVQARPGGCDLRIQLDIPDSLDIGVTENWNSN